MASGCIFYLGDMDPCMVIIPPVEQFGNNTTFRTAPSTENSRFNDGHYFTLYVEGPLDASGNPETDQNKIEALLSTINVIPGTGSPYKPNSRDVNFYHNRIPGTPYYFAR